MTTRGRAKINPNPNAGCFLSFGSCPVRGNFRSKQQIIMTTLFRRLQPAKKFRITIGAIALG
jgi:hypothetical protein